MSLRTKLHPLGGGSNEKIFIRPNLTSDGTLGGNSFAVSAQSVNRSYPAWQAVDNSTTTECRSATSGTFYYLFYNPKALKVTKLYINYASTLNTVQIAASNNTSSYTQITSTFNGITLTLTNNNYYKYYRITFTASGVVRIRDIQITAEEQ